MYNFQKKGLEAGVGFHMYGIAFILWANFSMISEIMSVYRGVMVIVVGNGHGDTSSNPGRDSLHFTLHKYPGKGMNPIISPSSYG